MFVKMNKFGVVGFSNKAIYKTSNYEPHIKPLEYYDPDNRSGTMMFYGDWDSDAYEVQRTITTNAINSSDQSFNQLYINIIIGNNGYIGYQFQWLDGSGVLQTSKYIYGVAQSSGDATPKQALISHMFTFQTSVNMNSFKPISISFDNMKDGKKFTIKIKATCPTSATMKFEMESTFENSDYDYLKPESVDVRSYYEQNQIDQLKQQTSKIDQLESNITEFEDDVNDRVNTIEQSLNEFNNGLIGSFIAG